MLPSERSLLMADQLQKARPMCDRMFGKHSGEKTVEKFAREKMRDVCLAYLGEHPSESLPKRRA